MSSKPEWGVGYDYPARMHLLWWESLPVPDSSAIEALNETVRGAGIGVYCIEGSHDARRDAGPLYIGRTTDDFLQRLKVDKGSLGHFFLRSSNADPEVFQAADAWNIVVRWARMSDPDAVADVERLLIRFHKPNYNHRDLVGADSKNLVVVNVGAKGTLLPVLASQYFAPPGMWPT
jgi:hypothetical protein